MAHEIVLKASDVDLFNKADKFGLGGGVLLKLLIQYGPAIVKLLLDLLDKKQEGPPNVVGGWFDDIFFVRSLLAGLLKAHRAEIMQYLDDVENAVLDKIVQKLES